MTNGISVRVATAFLLFLAVTTGYLFASGQKDSTVRSVSAADSSPSNWPHPRSGEYVVYRDYSWTEPTWTGFLRYDDSTWGAVLVTPSKNSRISVLFRTEQAGDTLVLVGQNIISKIGPGDVEGVNYLMGLLPDLYRWRKSVDGSTCADDPLVQRLSGRSILLPAPCRIERRVPLFGGDVLLLWMPEVPVFNLHSLTAPDGSPRLALERQGRISSGGDNEFFDFDLLPQTGSPPDFELAPERKEEVLTVDAVLLNLDSQWTKIADNTFLLGNTAIIIVDAFSPEEAGLEPDNLPLALYRLFAVSSGDTVLRPGSTEMTGDRHRFRIESVFYDRQSGLDNRDIKYCIVSSDNKICTVVSLTVQNETYIRHASYFNSLF